MQIGRSSAPVVGRGRPELGFCMGTDGLFSSGVVLPVHAQRVRDGTREIGVKSRGAECAVAVGVHRPGPTCR